MKIDNNIKLSLRRFLIGWCIRRAHFTTFHQLILHHLLLENQHQRLKYSLEQVVRLFLVSSLENIICLAFYDAVIIMRGVENFLCRNFLSFSPSGVDDFFKNWMSLFLFARQNGPFFPNLSPSSSLPLLAGFHWKENLLLISSSYIFL